MLNHGWGWGGEKILWAYVCFSSMHFIKFQAHTVGLDSVSWGCERPLTYVGENVVILFICVLMTQTCTFGAVICLGISPIYQQFRLILFQSTRVLRGFALSKMEAFMYL